MKQKSIKFLLELQKRLYYYRISGRSTFVFAESLDGFCLSIGYASAVAAYDDLPQDVRNYVHLTRNKANPMLYAHVAIAATPTEIIFTDTSDDKGRGQVVMNFTFDESTIKYLKSTYVC